MLELGIGSRWGPNPYYTVVWGGVYGTISPVRLGAAELGIEACGVGDDEFCIVTPV